MGHSLFQILPNQVAKASQFVPTSLSPGGYANFGPNSLNAKKIPHLLFGTCKVLWGATPLPDGENSPCKHFYCQNLAIEAQTPVNRL